MVNSDKMRCLTHISHVWRLHLQTSADCMCQQSQAQWDHEKDSAWRTTTLKIGSLEAFTKQRDQSVLDQIQQCWWYRSNQRKWARRECCIASVHASLMPWLHLLCSFSQHHPSPFSSRSSDIAHRDRPPSENEQPVRL